MRLHVRLTTKAVRDGIDGWGQDERGRPVLNVRVRAAPVEGRANAALIALIAKSAGVSKSRVSLVSGDTSRLKALDIEGIETFEIK